MKLPGNAWLEWKIQNHGDEHQLRQTATFRPQGVLGRLYWFSLYPFHVLIFKAWQNLLRQPQRLLQI